MLVRFANTIAALGWRRSNQFADPVGGLCAGAEPCQGLIVLA